MNTEKNTESRPLRQLTETMKTDIQKFRSTATGLEEQLQRFVQERPIAAVLSSLGLGFVVARIFARR